MKIINLYDEINGLGVVFCQQLPNRRTICIGRTNFFISLPNVIFKIFYRKSYNFSQAYASGMVFTNNKKIYYPTLPNIANSLSI